MDPGFAAICLGFVIVLGIAVAIRCATVKEQKAEEERAEQQALRGAQEREASARRKRETEQQAARARKENLLKSLSSLKGMTVRKLQFEYRCLKDKVREIEKGRYQAYRARTAHWKYQPNEADDKYGFTAAVVKAEQDLEDAKIRLQAYETALRERL